MKLSRLIRNQDLIIVAIIIVIFGLSVDHSATDSAVHKVKFPIVENVPTVHPMHTLDDHSGFSTNLMVNNTPIGIAMIDTGSADVVISQDMARKAHVNLTHSKIQEFVNADDSINVCRILNQDIQVGHLIRNAELAVCNRGGSLIGMSFVSQIKMSVDHDVMTLE